MQQTDRFKVDERGLVSIMVASVLMVVMSLITIGFARIAQRENRQAIDEQLSTQAFYAAESGINVITKTISKSTASKTDCDVSGYNNGEISAEKDVYFTCVLIDSHPDSLYFGNDSISSSAKLVSFKTSAQPASFVFQWTDNDHDGVLSSCSPDTNLNSGDWGGDTIGALKLDIYPVPSAPFSRDDLVNNQFSTIVLPCGGGTDSSVDYSEFSGASNLGKHTGVDCNTASVDYDCQLTITAPNSASAYYVRMSTLYSNLNVQITAQNGAGQRLLFSEGQVVVDVTGRAGDVYRRLQARVPVYDEYTYPDFQIKGAICKQYEIGATSIDDQCN